MAGLRVATWNCQHGRPVPARIGEAVAELDVDVLGMQEVDRGSRRVGRRDLAAQAQEAFEGHLTWAPAFTFSDGGDYGNALLLRGEVREELVLPLPGRRRGKGSEPRVASITEVEVDGRRWTVANTHLSTHRLMAAEQLVALLDAMRSWPAPRVLLGDLNLEVPHLLPSLTAESYQLAIGPATHPAHRPRRQIDHVAVSGRGCRVIPVEAVQLTVGDHRALIADVSCPDEPSTFG
jgi:endonuclease/exonuclease/phosphatase family metal-dependent hydrolase